MNRKSLGNQSFLAIYIYIYILLSLLLLLLLQSRFRRRCVLCEVSGALVTILYWSFFRKTKKKYDLLYTFWDWVFISLFFRTSFVWLDMLEESTTCLIIIVYEIYMHYCYLRACCDMGQRQWSSNLLCVCVCACAPYVRQTTTTMKYCFFVRIICETFSYFLPNNPRAFSMSMPKTESSMCTFPTWHIISTIVRHVFEFPVNDWQLCPSCPIIFWIMSNFPGHCGRPGDPKLYSKYAYNSAFAFEMDDLHLSWTPFSFFFYQIHVPLRRASVSCICIFLSAINLNSA